MHLCGFSSEWVPFVVLQTVWPSCSIIALFAFLQFLSPVILNVLSRIDSLIGWIVALCTLVWFLSGVNKGVPLQITSLAKWLVALWTNLSLQDSFFALYVVDAHQDFYMRIAMRISAYADHPHEPHGSATAWPSLLHSHYIHITFTLHSHYIHTTFTLHSHYIHTTNTLHLHYIYILTERPVVLSNAIF